MGVDDPSTYVDAINIESTKVDIFIKTVKSITYDVVIPAHFFVCCVLLHFVAFGTVNDKFS